MAPVILEIQKRPQLSLSICLTAQHREMLDQPLSLFNIKADYDLNLMSPGQSLAGLTAKVIRGLDETIEKDQPDIVLVQGDTTTAFCGALAAFYHKKKVGHVEAGLRTRQRYSPFPEEINRRLISPLADVHFAPTEKAKEVLLSEGYSQNSIHVTGNTVIDALLLVKRQMGEKVPTEIPAETLQKIGGKKVVLITGHRRESFDGGFESVCHAIMDIAHRFEDVEFIYPVHLNPRAREPVYRLLQGHSRIHLLAPLSYEPFVWLMNRASVILTDSGGIQEEAPSLGKPVLVTRESTERPEGVEAGNASLVGTDRSKIVAGLSRLLSDERACREMASVRNPYGDGTAAKKICDQLIADLA